MKNQIQRNCGSVIHDSFFESATDEQKIHALNIIIDRELEKPENEVDMELVKSCMSTIEEIHGGVRERTNKELNENLDQIISSKSKRSHFMLTYGRFARLISTMIAVVLVLGITIKITAKASGYDSAFNWISDSLTEILKWPSGSYEKNGITITVGDRTTFYNSIDELLKNENLDIMYPTELPEGISFESIAENIYTDGTFDLYFLFSTDTIGVHVLNYDLTMYEVDTPYDTVFANGNTFYIIEGPNGSYQANCVTDRCAYIITSNNYDNLLTLINSLRSSI